MKSHDFWLLFDDDIVEVGKFTRMHTCDMCSESLFPHPAVCVLPSFFQKIDAQAIEEFYGLTSEISKNSESGYILFYQSRD